MVRRAAIAAPNAHATSAAEQALAAGGTAVDAAIAAMVSATITEPGIVAPLGGCYLNVWPVDGDPVVIDANVEMPGRDQPGERFGAGLIEVRSDYGGGMTTYVGPGSVATPGMFAGMGMAHERYGAAPWSALLQPAADTARAGFALSRTAQSYLVLVADTILAWDPATRALLTVDGAAPEVGHPVRDEALASSLEQIGAEGWQTVYTGDIARRIVEDMRERGGLLGATDLTAYRAVARPALRSRLGHWDLACNPPPSIGGPVLTAILRLLHASDSEITPARAATVMKDVLDIRLDRIDTAADLAAAGAELLDTLHTIGATGLPTSASTAHVSVVDESGMACALTASAGYGSGMTIAGTGLTANNALGELELNRLGLHALAPGTRLASNMAPTTARLEDGTVLAIGTPGADRITTALAQVIIHVARHGESLQTAIDRPRMHPRRLEDGTDRIEHEQDEVLAASLDAAGLPRHEHPPQSMYFGGVGGALLRPDGTLEAGADPRRAAATLVT
ncbi:gamma-glutamyltransferase [Ornithinimicrobium humiphilum]|uniref:Gamma-glutamyltranspeptidase/glutathione hydrolase n=1 Tax=Ornithinimicrobium humiphilum TaxID=125288 RepID=A0A543KLP7_9MICO|nr:gamma-glutamyltransferase [Ornithinimicrobium humiphilum]TQM95982.1 gamma-glutamyltranspeptidase/glutathione hydrolase [Ornithinimicrobium humiphilum]